MTKFSLAISVLWFFVFSLFASLAIACSPYPFKTDEELFEEASYVFRGLVTKTELTGPEYEGELWGVKVSFKVLENLAGDATNDDFVISTIGYIGGCAPPFLVGLQYLFVVEPIEENSFEDLDEQTRTLMNDSLGFVTIFGTTQLPSYETRLDEAMEDVRKWAKKIR